MEIEGANDCLRSRRIQIGVRYFGPIAQRLVDLPPLTVFVGPSNTGKTKFPILRSELAVWFVSWTLRRLMLIVRAWDVSGGPAERLTAGAERRTGERERSIGILIHR